VQCNRLSRPQRLRSGPKPRSGLRSKIVSTARKPGPPAHNVANRERQPSGAHCHFLLVGMFSYASFRTMGPGFLAQPWGTVGREAQTPISLLCLAAARIRQLGPFCKLSSRGCRHSSEQDEMSSLHLLGARWRSRCPPSTPRTPLISRSCRQIPPSAGCWLVAGSQRGRNSSLQEDLPKPIFHHLEGSPVPGTDSNRRLLTPRRGLTVRMDTPLQRPRVPMA